MVKSKCRNMKFIVRKVIFIVFAIAVYCAFRSIVISTGNSYVNLDGKLLLPITGVPQHSLPLMAVSAHALNILKTDFRQTTAPMSSTFKDHSRDALYNTVNCPHQYLGVTKYAAELCANESQAICDSLNCRSLLSGNGNNLYYDVAKNLMSGHARKAVPESFFSDMHDCDAFKKQRGYHTEPLSQEEADFPLAFNFLVHTNAEQVERLLRALYRPQNLFCIHIDAKASSTFISAIRRIAGCFENVFVASKLERVTWAGYSRLQADINCMNEHLNTSVPWKYLINTAGLAYPLKTIGEMVKVLKIYNGANDIEGMYGERVIRTRFQKEWQEDPEHGLIVDTGRRNPKPPHLIDIVRGSAYGIFSRKFVEFIIRDQKAIDLLNWAKKTWSPDEIYWATLQHTYSNPHLRTPGGFSGYPSEKPWLAVYASWYAAECHGKMPHGVCTFGIGDLPYLVKRKEFFANKFDIDFEPLAFECIAQWIRHKEICPPEFDAEYYKSLPFIKPQS